MIRTIGLALATALLASTLHAQGSGAASSAEPAGALVPAAGNANLSVASVRMADGVRASKVIGAAVYGDDANTQLGSVNDLMLSADNTVKFAIVSVGGVMGLGGKLVAIPFAQLRTGSDGKFTLGGATKESLNAMPIFVYNN